MDKKLQLYHKVLEGEKYKIRSKDMEKKIEGNRQVLL